MVGFRGPMPYVRVIEESLFFLFGSDFLFFPPQLQKMEKGGHLETRMWETCDITVWDTTGDLGFPVTRDRDIVKSVRDTVEGRQTNFVISSEILHFCRQVLGEWDRGNEPTQCMKIVRDLVDQ